MANFKDIIDQQIANVFNNVIAPGGLSVDLTISYLVSQGEYDPVTETTNPVTNVVSGIVAVLAKPSFTDSRDHGVSLTDGKLLVPGSFIPAEPNTDTDRALFNNRSWNIRKCVGVPGQGIYIIYVNL